MSNFCKISLFRGTDSIGITRGSGGTSYNLELPGTAPTADQILKYDGSTMVWAALPGGATGDIGTITADAPLTATETSGTVAITWQSGAANLVLATPSASSGTPSYRALVSNDIPNLSATKITTGTLSASRMPSGTVSTFWQIDTGNSGIRIDSSSASLATLYRNDGTTLADLRAGTVTANAVSTTDTKVTINSDVTTGTPTEDMTIVANRGGSANAQVSWVESAGQWLIGVVGAMLPVARKTTFTFTNASLVSGEFTFIHNLNTQDFTYQVWSNTGVSFYVESTILSANAAKINLATLGTLTGTWKVVVTI